MEHPGSRERWCASSGGARPGRPEQPPARPDPAEPAQAQSNRDIIGRAGTFQPVQKPESALGKRQRDLRRARHRPKRRLSRLGLIEPFSQFGNGGSLKEAADGKLDAQRSADPAHQTRSQKRVAPQLKEVVVNADLWNCQDLGKERAEDLFLGSAWSAPGGAGARRELRSRQRFAIQLAVRRQWQSLQHHNGPRHHVLRQTLGNVAAQERRISASGRFAPPHSPPAACRRLDPLGRSPRPAPPRDGGPGPPQSRPAQSRKPRILTCWSARPRNSSTPSARHRARSPVRYIRVPGAPKGSATKRSALKAGRFR